MRAYEFVISLQDRFTGVLNRISSQYERKISTWDRITEGFKRRFSGLGSAADRLAGKFRFLAAPVKLKVDSSEVDKATRKVGLFQSLLSRIRGGGGLPGIGSTAVAPGPKGGGFSRFLGSSMLGAAVLGGAAGGIATGVVDQIVRAAGDAVTVTVGRAQDIASTRFNLAAMMGAPVAQRLERDITEFAPGRRDSLLEASQRLSGAGVAPERMMPMLKMLNNLASLTNTSVSELAMVQAKIKATGYLQGDELDMFRERGINLNPYLAQVMKVPETALKKLQEKGLITYDILEKALARMVGPGGRFGNLYEQKLQTDTKEREQNLGGLWGIRMENLGAKILPLKNQAISFLTEFVQKMDPIEKSLGNLARGVVSVFRPVWQLISGAAERMGLFQGKATTAEKVIALISGTTDVFAGVVQRLASAIDFLVNNPIGNLIAALWGVSKVMAGVQLAFSGVQLALALAGFSTTAVISGLAAVHTVVLGIGAALWVAYENSEKFRNAILDGWEGWKTFAQGFGMGIKLLLEGNMKAFWAYSQSLDRAADRKAALAAYQDDARRRPGPKVPVIPGRARLLGQASAASPQGVPTAPPPADGSAISRAAGLQSAVGNSRSQTITINVESLIGQSEINVYSGDEGADEIERKVLDAISRGLYSAGKIANP